MYTTKMYNFLHLCMVRLVKLEQNQTKIEQGVKNPTKWWECQWLVDV